ncbi:MAG: hypothetical protein ACNYPF_04780 [Candidatus Puniceispirillales bacterium WSBS_2018_MAG_OTU23]
MKTVLGTVSIAKNNAPRLSPRRSLIAAGLFMLGVALGGWLNDHIAVIVNLKYVALIIVALVLLMLIGIMRAPKIFTAGFIFARNNGQVELTIQHVKPQ